MRRGDFAGGGAAPSAEARILAIVGVYVGVAGAWILLSDTALAWLVSDPEMLVLAGALKGVLFVGITAWLLHALMQRRIGRRAQALHVFMESAPAAMAMLDGDLRYLFASRRWASDFGLDTARLAGGRHEEVFPHAPARWRDAFRQALAGAGERCEAERLPRPDGGEDWLRWEVLPWHEADGRIGGIVVMAEVITERRRADMALRESEQRFQDIAAASADWIWEVDAQGRFTYASDSVRELLGYAPQEILGKTPFAFMPPEEAQRLRGEFSAIARRRGIVRDYDNINLHRDGSLRRIQITAMPVVDGDGRLRGYRGLGRDVTERRRAQMQLRQLSLAVEQTPQKVVITDLEPRIEYVNAAFVAGTGYAREEVVDRNPRMLGSGETPKAVFESLWRALRAGRPWQGEFVNKRKDGSRCVDFVHIAPLRQPDGRITHYVGVQEDVTEKKRIGAELDRHRHHLEELVVERTTQLAEASARAQAASRAKSEFLANMSHEIRTPMNAIVGLTRLLQREPLTAAQHERLRKIEGATTHLLALINDILDISKIEAGRLTLAPAPFARDALVEEVTLFVAERIGAKGLRFEVDVAALPDTLVGDRTRIVQALINLLGNAVKFTEAGSIRLSGALLEAGADDCLIRFEVEDTGIGIAAGDLERVFDPFEQADGSTTRRHGGTGLGLPITRRIARLMAGDAGAQSTPGAGSRFWITMRLAKARVGAAPEPVRGAGEAPEARLCAAVAGRPVLLAEDEPVSREIALELLREVAGLTVDAAENGRQAVELAAARPYALILMDMQMPEMDGLTATAAIRRLPGHATTPIVAMTANAFGEDRERCLAAGMDGHIAKPVDPRQLFGALLDRLTRESAAA